ncbi:uncharacterized protein LOC120641948 isoform X4 [Panicum virgatum]|uniref:uncharacterized protein LOC120641948 isoform X4 n=1 Tax=Panicum virgatum TaxID=38727 RepID=UPI0019D59426|nr:uncharacterized protein LOC120641948 isoform X4 [Panicum virgatum]
MPGTAPSLSQSPSIPGRGRVPGRRSARSPSADPLRPRPPIRSRHHHEARLEEVVVIRRDRQRWLSRPTSPAGDPHRPGRCYVHCAASTRPTTTHPCTILESQFLSATFSKVRNLRRVRTRKDIFSWCKGASIGWHSDDNKPNLRHRAFTLWLLLSNLEDWKKQLRKLLDVTMVTDSHGSFTASSPALGWRAAAASSPSSSAAGAAGQRAACPAAGACSPKKQRAAGAAGQQRGHAAHGGMRELRRRRAASSSRRQFRDRAGTVAMAATAVGERPVELDDEGNESDGKKSSPQISNTRR